MSALAALLAGSIVAFIPLSLVTLGLSAVHVLPINGDYPSEPGRGWPWRLDGAWAALADLGPLLLAVALVAGGVGFYVGSRTGRRTARWPLALCALLVGWIPVAQGGHAGLLGVGGGFMFLAMWWTTRTTAKMPRPTLPGNRRVLVAIAAVLAVGLVAVTLSYAVLHPVRAEIATTPTSVSLRDGVSERLPLDLHNEGPLSVRILGLSLHDAPRLRVTRLEREGPRTEGPTIDSLFSPFGRPRIAPGGSHTASLTLAGPARCSGPLDTVGSVDLRLAVAGVHRTRQVALAQPLRVVCRRPHRR